MSSVTAITKTLSANDTGETGGHQAGILIPKNTEILDFFPSLDRAAYNPRTTLVFASDNDVSKWSFEFIYYNNKLFGGTRNEFRLTGMTKFIRANNLKAGDDLILGKRENGIRYIGYKRKNVPKLSSNGVLKLGSGWKVINIGEKNYG